MGRVRVEEEIGAQAEAVWRLVRDFGGIQRWTPQMTSCTVDGEGPGAVRTIDMGGITVRERLERLDDAARTLSYSIVEVPLPVEGYLATIEVAEGGPGRTRITWSSRFESAGMPEDQLAGLFETVYRQGIEGLRQVLAA